MIPSPSGLPTSSLPVRFTIHAPPESAITGLLRGAFSRDGRVLAFNVSAGSGSQIHLRRLDQVEIHPVPGVEVGVFPFFSPDGQWLAFFSERGGGGELMRVPVTGGTPHLVCRYQPLMRGGVWGADGMIYFCTHSRGLWRVAATGGEPELLAAPDFAEGERELQWPSLLQGRDAILCTVFNGKMEESRVAAPATGRDSS